MKTVSIGDVELAVEDRGSGHTLLFVHGFPLDHSMWEAQIARFADSYRVIAPDLRGFGASPLGSESAGQVSMETYADDLARLLDRLDVREPIVYCGLSMGGYIAWQFWRKYASRLAAVVLCDTRSIADTPQAAAGRAELAARVMAEGTEPLVTAMLGKLLGSDAADKRPECVEKTRQMIHRASRAGAAAALGGMATRPDVTAQLGQIRIPTLLLCGEHDVISPPDEMRGIAKNIPGAEFAVIPGVGHMSPLENARVFNDALARFLRERLSW